VASSTPEFEPVKLTAPSGAEYTAHSATEYNNLVFGQGYKPVQPRKNSPEAVAARTAEAPDEAKPNAKK
jgi:hypothetical protein